MVPLAAPPAVLTAPIQNSTTTTTVVTGTPAVMDNSPSPVSNSTHAIPLLTASLIDENSSSYRIVAGANMDSADPLALQPVGSVAADNGSVSLGGYFAYADGNTVNGVSQTLIQPTMVRTGTGLIDIAAANNIEFSSQIAPAVIYTAGTPSTPSGSTSSIVTPSPSATYDFDLLATNAVNPYQAGDISIHAGNDISGVETTTGANGPGGINPGFGASQFWWEWMQTGNTYANGQIAQTSINFGAFDQGVMSVGGNVTVTAGGNISDLSVSLPTTWYLSSGVPVTVGGGNLTVTAGGSILSGDYFVANGTGTLTAGGLIGSSGLSQVLNSVLGTTEQVSTLLAAQNGAFNVSARQGVDIGGIFDPSYVLGSTIGGYGFHPDSQGYSTASAVNVVSTTGNVALNTLSGLSLIGASQQSGDDSYVLPATVNLTAFPPAVSRLRGTASFIPPPPAS